jgi:hypothetical protein
MAVLLFDSAVVIRADRLDRLYPGGLAAFSISHEDDRFCCDGELASVGFASPREAWALVRSLQEDGLVPFREGEAADLACMTADAGGVVPCGWIEFGRFEGGLPSLRGVAACRLLDGTSVELALPIDFQRTAGVASLPLGDRPLRQRHAAAALVPAARGAAAAMAPAAGRERPEPADWRPLAGAAIDERRLEVCIAYARMVNTGDHGVLAGFLHEHASFRSEWTGVEVHGADTVLAYLEAKLLHIRLAGVSIRAEVAFLGDASGDAGEACVLVQQASAPAGSGPPRHRWSGTLLVESEQGLAARLVQARSPRPSQCLRSGVRPR